MKKNNKDNRYEAESYLVSFGFDESGNITLAVVGKKNPKDAVEVINAFSGYDARELHTKLTVKKLKG